MDYSNVIGAVSLIIIGTLIFIIIKKSRQLEKYSKIVDIDEEYAKIDKQTKKLQNDYLSNMKIYKKLIEEISIVEEDLEFTTFGVYKPHFDYATSEEFKNNISVVVNKQKDMIKNKNAVTCATEWEVAGSKVKGRTMTNRNIKLTLRAFNGECDTAIAKVKWNNVNVMETRIQKTYDAINKLNESNHIDIDYEFLLLKLKELRLTHEYKEKVQDEKEEQREIREQMREEEKAQKEYEKAQKEAEKEEANYKKALDKARRELDDAKDDEVSELQQKIELLEKEIKEAEAKKQRALSQAQLTRSGHVYVISNIGSFGEDVYKIGMTRRLEPLDRVKELGDASVPFTFDVHAMIYSKDAPTLEKKLHKIFEKSRVNMMNNRKEFFNVSLEDIEQKVHENGALIEFTKLAEAKDYRESIAIKNKLDIVGSDDLIQKNFPLEL